jgi:hypothetical protein
MIDKGSVFLRIVFLHFLLCDGLSGADVDLVCLDVRLAIE